MLFRNKLVRIFLEFVIIVYTKKIGVTNEKFF